MGNCEEYLYESYSSGIGEYGLEKPFIILSPLIGTPGPLVGVWMSALGMPGGAMLEMIAWWLGDMARFKILISCAWL